MLLPTDKLNLKCYELHETKELLNITKVFIAIINILIIIISVILSLLLLLLLSPLVSLSHFLNPQSGYV